MIPEEIEKRLDKIEQAVGLSKGIIEPPIDKIQSSVVGPPPPYIPKEEDELGLGLRQEIQQMIKDAASSAMENLRDGLQPDVYEIINEYNSNPNNTSEFFNTIIQRGFKVKIFEVQSEATGDGVYNCYEQTLDATEWDDTDGDDKFDDKNDTSVEVLNLLENNPEADYVASLAPGDRIAAWQWIDDEGRKRWVGLPVERQRVALSTFEVQSVTAVDGVYLCFRQLMSGGWGATETEVMNLIENDTLASYTPALAYKDRISGWQTVDEEGTSRWVGIPITPSVRMARTTEAAGASTNITCNLIANDGETEILSGLGAGIEVYFRVCTSDNMTGASPRFNDNDYLFVQNISGKWWCVGVAQGSENRACE